MKKINKIGLIVFLFFVLGLTSIFALTSIKVYQTSDATIYADANQVCVEKRIINDENKKVVLGGVNNIKLDPKSTTTVKECYPKKNNLDEVKLNSKLVYDNEIIASTDLNVTAFRFRTDDKSLIVGSLK